MIIVEMRKKDDSVDDEVAELQELCSVIGLTAPGTGSTWIKYGEYRTLEEAQQTVQNAKILGLEMRIK